MNITIITIAYDGYGRFFSDWFGSILKQEVLPREVVVVLSKNHKMVRTLPEMVNNIKVKVIYEPERWSMGRLRNIAIENATSEWILNVDVDDVLLANAIKDIQELSVKCDAVALRYYKKYNKAIEQQRTPIPKKEDYLKWRENYCGASGYVAFKKQFNGEMLLCEDTEYPNFPFMFKCGALGMRFVETEKPCAVYKKNDEGHSLSGTEQQRTNAMETIEKFAKHYYEKYE
jgi:glycosyltransferase involved in cell wall biosynthesis